MKVTFCDVYFQPPHTLFYATSSKIIPELHTSPFFFFMGGCCYVQTPLSLMDFCVLVRPQQEMHCRVGLQ